MKAVTKRLVVSTEFVMAICFPITPGSTLRAYTLCRALDCREARSLSLYSTMTALMSDQLGLCFGGNRADN